MNIRSDFSKRLKKLRVESGYSQTEFAKMARISRSHLIELESALPKKRVTIDTIQKLAAALRIKPDQLLKFD